MLPFQDARHHPDEIDAYECKLLCEVDTPDLPCNGWPQHILHIISGISVVSPSRREFMHRRLFHPNDGGHPKGASIESRPRTVASA